VLAALWELSSLETFIPQIARVAAVERDLYAERFWTQRWITLAFLAVASVGVRRRQGRPPRPIGDV
jgi:hypothetical protein